MILVANKCEGRAGQQGLAEAHGLGLGEPIPVSAEHGEGLGDLHEALARHIEPMPEEDDERAAASTTRRATRRPTKRPLLLAIVGRPNVGKSTLLNRLVGEERMLTGPEAGITRDSIRVEWQWRGRLVRLIDTAGMRRRSRIDAKLEAASVADTLDAIRLADVVVVVLDAADMAEKQDLTIAGRVIDEGRALVIAVNKTDLLADDQAGLEPGVAQARRPAGGVVRPGQGRADRRLLGAERPRRRAADAQGVRDLRHLEQARADAQAQSLAARDGDAASAAARQGPAHPAALHDPDQEAAADLRAVGQPAGRAGRRLSALSDAIACATISACLACRSGWPCANRKIPSPAAPRNSDRQSAGRVAKVFYATIGSTTA
mgnify:CR=1 FL=1